MSWERFHVYFNSMVPHARPPQFPWRETTPRPIITSHACPIYIHKWTNGVWNFISSTIWDEISCKLSLWWNQIWMSRPHPLRTPRPRRASRLCSRFIGFINSVFVLLFLLLLPSQLNVPTDRRSNEILFTWNDSRFLFTSPMLFRVVFSSEMFPSEKVFSPIPLLEDWKKSRAIDATAVFILTFSIFWTITFCPNERGSIRKFIFATRNSLKGFKNLQFLHSIIEALSGTPFVPSARK